ncbi:hypothetical protein FQA47_008358 [Oryzias melastigma]|uniref:Uncharacterized protein n=1 Tax=Oryzias melastigma TaxID=30732 RepID=A0A834CNU2_ORYME|nr:hypothetical protein FQA47_008358 [Oryzias melastigma]
MHTQEGGQKKQMLKIYFHKAASSSFFSSRGCSWNKKRMREMEERKNCFLEGLSQRKEPLSLALSLSVTQSGGGLVPFGWYRGDHAHLGAAGATRSRRGRM